MNGQPAPHSAESIALKHIAALRAILELAAMWEKKSDSKSAYGHLLVTAANDIRKTVIRELL